MNSVSDLRRRIEDAARLLESAQAPAWLLRAVRGSIALAQALAPEAPQEHKPADHFYPH